MKDKNLTHRSILALHGPSRAAGKILQWFKDLRVKGGGLVGKMVDAVGLPTYGSKT